MPLIGITKDVIEDASVADLEGIYRFLSEEYESGSGDVRETLSIGRWLVKELRDRNIKFPYNRLVSAVDNVPIELIMEVSDRPLITKSDKQYESFLKIYDTNEELPKSVRDALPSAAQSVFRNVFNSQVKAGKSEEIAFKSAWGALKNQGWRKEGDKWVKKSINKTIEFGISKTSPDKKRVFGWAYVTEKNGEQIVDHSEEFVSEVEIEEAFYKFVQNSRKAGEMHVSKDAGELIEMMVFTKEKQEALGIDLGKVGVWVGFQLTDSVFNKVKSGEYKMMSIGGSGFSREIGNT